MNPEQKKRREGLIASQIITSKRAKKHVARPVKQGERVSISHLLRPQTKQ